MAISQYRAGILSNGYLSQQFGKHFIVFIIFLPDTLMTHQNITKQHEHAKMKHDVRTAPLENISLCLGSVHGGGLEKEHPQTTTMLLAPTRDIYGLMMLAH